MRPLILLSIALAVSSGHTQRPVYKRPRGCMTLLPNEELEKSHEERFKSVARYLKAADMNLKREFCEPFLELDITEGIDAGRYKIVVTFLGLLARGASSEDVHIRVKGRAVSIIINTKPSELNLCPTTYYKVWYLPRFVIPEQGTYSFSDGQLNIFFPFRDSSLLCFDFSIGINDAIITLPPSSLNVTEC